MRRNDEVEVERIRSEDWANVKVVKTGERGLAPRCYLAYIQLAVTSAFSAAGGLSAVQGEKVTLLQRKDGGLLLVRDSRGREGEVIETCFSTPSSRGNRGHQRSLRFEKLPGGVERDKQPIITWDTKAVLG